ncbi:MAG: arabinan endo-1,5-alpha-L-arabinosidase [Bacteroidales bacterium]|nr:arabinan endo-1,5-alpha-L-arabinosidase [Bacteroidales bacterium]MBN2818967.1 arabinan endo-1,5-alpha-L-arabinosidase [Bacteroidales bacterium]
MLQRFFFIIILLSVLVNACGQSKQIVIHDPVAIKAEGKYYIFGTGPGLESAVSDDKENWSKYSPGVFDPMPEWFKKEVPNFNGHVWAPDIVFHKGKYYLYYSVSSFGSNLSCIGVATNTTLDKANNDYKWEDHGVVIQSVPGRDNWNAIDPNIIFDENNVPWLAFGSFWDGIKIVKLNEELLTIAEPQEWNTIAARERDFGLDDSEPGNGMIEAPFIIMKDDYYYLFVSFDKCCRGSESNYNVRIGRSKSVTGPYLDKEGVPMTQGGGTLFIEGDENFYAIGHNSVYNFDGVYYMYSHGYDVNDRGKPKLLVHILEWNDEGWPFIKNYIDK